MGNRRKRKSWTVPTAPSSRGRAERLPARLQSGSAPSGSLAAATGFRPAPLPCRRGWPSSSPPRPADLRGVARFGLVLSVLSLPVRVLVLVALDLEGVLPRVGLGGKQDVPGGGGGGPADLWLASGLIKLRLRQSLASLIKCFSGGGSLLVRARIGRQPGAVSSWAPGRATAAARARETEGESGKRLRLEVRTGRFGDLPLLARLPGGAFA